MTRQQPAKNKSENFLAVVIVARNEARSIVACIESVLAAVSNRPDTQVCLVDSASTDETRALAQRYPVRILQLRPHWRLTPAAGRYVGTRRTQGRYILFLDGDMILNGAWLKEGLTFLETHPQAAAVSGDLDETYLDDEGKVVGRLPSRYQVRQLTEVRGLGGAGLYRREALDQVGTFNPFVPLREEAELALRLRRAGYKLYRLPIPIAEHFSPPRETFREIGRRYRAGYYAGFGRALYYATRNGLGWPFLREQGMDYLYFALYLTLGVLSLGLLAIFRWWWPSLLWMALTALMVLVFAVRKGGLRNSLIGLVSRGLIVYGSVAGSISAARDPAEYPTDVLVLQ